MCLDGNFMNVFVGSLRQTIKLLLSYLIFVTLANRTEVRI